VLLKSVTIRWATSGLRAPATAATIGMTVRPEARAAFEYFQQHPPEPIMEIRVPRRVIQSIARAPAQMLLDRDRNN
jgi:hypothetical protein